MRVTLAYSSTNMWTAEKNWQEDLKRIIEKIVNTDLWESIRKWRPPILTLNWSPLHLCHAEMGVLLTPHNVTKPCLCDVIYECPLRKFVSLTTFAQVALRLSNLLFRSYVWHMIRDQIRKCSSTNSTLALIPFMKWAFKLWAGVQDKYNLAPYYWVKKT